MQSTTQEGRKAVFDAAERYMRQLVLSDQIKNRLHTEAPVPTLSRLALGPYIAISRETGAGAAEIAHAVGLKLGWDIVGRDILDALAERYHLPRGLLEFVDETSANWWHEMLGTLLDQKIVTQEAFVAHLGKMILLAASKGPVVFIGRGAQFFLPRERGVSIRIVAPEEMRIKYLMQSRSMSRPAAQDYIRTTEKGRRDFVSRYFHRDVSDAHLYDLTLNLEQMSREDAVEHILDFYKRWSASHLPHED